MKTSQKLVDLYQQMYELTEPECASVCKLPRSCCSPEYCAMAMDIAADSDEPIVPPPGHSPVTNVRGEVIPLLGTNGCIAAPHLRPLCTVHTCEIGAFGVKLTDQAWTEKYFKLRDSINDQEGKEKRW